MELTEAMLQAAIDKAVEAGLLPKYVRKDESAVDREIMKLVLRAALDAGKSSLCTGICLGEHGSRQEPHA